MDALPENLRVDLDCGGRTPSVVDIRLKFLDRVKALRERNRLRRRQLLYDRDFTGRDPLAYFLGRDFRQPWYPGADARELDSVAPPFPDHAALDRAKGQDRIRTFQEQQKPEGRYVTGNT